MTSHADEPVVERLVAEIRTVQTSYHRLVLLVGPTDSGKGTALQQAADRVGGRLLNLNLEMSRRLLDLTTGQRALKFAQVLDETLGQDESPVFIHRTELIFDPAFQQDPVRLLRQLSKTRTVVAAWNGLVECGHLTYAEVGHAEYQRHQVEDLALIEMPTPDVR